VPETIKPFKSGDPQFVAVTCLSFTITRPRPRWQASGGVGEVEGVSALSSEAWRSALSRSRRAGFRPVRGASPWVGRATGRRWTQATAP